MKVITEPSVQTDRLGGVDVPSAEVLKEMHEGQYILRAAQGKLAEVPVEKVLLPHSDDMNPQGTQVDVGPDGTVYVRQSEILCKSTDGGRTWTARSITPAANSVGWRWKLLRANTFISISCSTGQNARAPAIVWASHDEGETWTKRAEIPADMDLPTGRPYTERYVHRGLNRLENDTLLWAVDIRDTPPIEGHGLFIFRSINGGHTWDGPHLMHDFGSEGGSTMLPSGRIFATLRYQRESLPSDSSDLERRNRSISPGSPWKNVFVLDSEDGGVTWSVPRQLTTVFGQTFGYPAALSNGTVIVIHDTRYGPGPPGSRAMISHDEGQTWLDEVYYLDYTTFTGSYTASVVIDDDTILTIAGSSQAGNGWDLVKNNTDMYAIRWKPVKD